MAGLTEQIDLAEVLVYLFFTFFTCLVIYLRGEDKREGYPLELIRPDRGRRAEGLPEMPAPKLYRKLDGGEAILPQEYEPTPIHALPRWQFFGAPLVPVGDPMEAGIGPGAYVLRRDRPFMKVDGSPQLLPLRLLPDHEVVAPDVELRGGRVFSARGEIVGLVRDLWFDQGVHQVRFVEVALTCPEGEGYRLIPSFNMEIDRHDGTMRIDDVSAAQVASGPRIKSPDEITAREEDIVNSYYASGYIYSVPAPDALA